MAKTDPKKEQKTEKSPIGTNTTVTLTVPVSAYQPIYDKVVSQYVSFTRIPGFRKGKAPKALVETQVGREKIMEHVLNELLPSSYEQAVAEAKITPLVQPRIEATSVNQGEDWVFTAHTAVAPEVSLGDYKKLIKEGAKAFAKQQQEAKKEETTQDKEAKPEGQENPEAIAARNKEAELAVIFQTLIEAISPAIPPLLIEQEYERLLRQFAQEIAQYRIDLETYLKHVGKTPEDLKNEYTGQAIASLQLEFILTDITKDLDPQVTEAEVQELLGPDHGKFSAHQQKHRQEEATSILKRRKTIEAMLAIAHA